jgi:pimeloyl-ACP methyl ester carboxylesterase
LTCEYDGAIVEAEVRRSRRIEVDGLGSPVIEAGPRDATEAVVFVHGNPGSCHDWDALLDSAGKLGRAVAFDMPGFGQADKPRDFDCEVPSYAKFMEGALQQLGVERAHLVLHDFGGPFGLAWGIQHPHEWASVVLIDIGVLPGYEWHTMAKIWRTPMMGELVNLWIPRTGWRWTMQKANPKGLPREFVDKMYDDYDRGTRRTVLKLYRSSPPLGEMALRLGQAMSALHKPALVVWGAKDAYVPAEYAERQREFFDVKEVVTIADSGHWPFQDSPEQVAEPLLRFLSEQLSVSSHA